jgi:Pol polyprotein, beta-barrel domain
LLLAYTFTSYISHLTRSQQKEAKKDSFSGDQDKSKGSSPSRAQCLFSAIETSMFLGESPVTWCYFIGMAASGNFTPKIEDLHDFKPFTSVRSFTAANGAEVQSKGEGTIMIEVSNCRHNYTIDNPHIQWMPDIFTHLFSPGQLINDGFTVNLHKEVCTVKDPVNWLLADIHDTYPANFSIIQPHSSLLIVQVVVEPTVKELDE